MSLGVCPGRERERAGRFDPFMSTRTSVRGACGFPFGGVLKLNNRYTILLAAFKLEHLSRLLRALLPLRGGLLVEQQLRESITLLFHDGGRARLVGDREAIGDGALRKEYKANAHAYLGTTCWWCAHQWCARLRHASGEPRTLCSLVQLVNWCFWSRLRAVLSIAVDRAMASAENPRWLPLGEDGEWAGERAGLGVPVIDIGIFRECGEAVPGGTSPETGSPRAPVKSCSR